MMMIYPLRCQSYNRQTDALLYSTNEAQSGSKSGSSSATNRNFSSISVASLQVRFRSVQVA